jgi:hypothetical protein
VPWKRPLTATVLVLLVLLLTGCNSHPADDPSDSGATRIGADQARALEQRVLDQRARAVLERRPALFLRNVDHGDKALMARQRQYYDNLAQLPLNVFRYQVRPAQWQGQRLLPRWGKDVRIPQVTLSVQLDGYDAVPVQRTVGFAFSFAGGKATIVSDRTARGVPLFLGTPAPWDLIAITVRRSSAVLGIFDRATAPTGDKLVTEVREGIAELDRRLPFTWSQHVIVYSVSSADVLRTFTDVPGGSIEHLGALTFPTYASPQGRSRVASTRMLVMPSSVRAGEPFLGRITRHELSHVAIASRDDGAPTWVSEGIAEYLGAAELPQRQRIIATEALARAQGGVGAMPDSKDFNDSDQEWHYALSWMAVDYIAATYGESRIWELMDAMHNGGSGTPDAEEDRVLDQVLGFDDHELARRAAARIRSIYG